MLQYSNLMTEGVGLYCDVLAAVGFIKEKNKIRFLSHPLGDLGVTYALQL